MTVDPDSGWLRLSIALSGAPMARAKQACALLGVARLVMGDDEDARFRWDHLELELDAAAVERAVDDYQAGRIPVAALIEIINGDDLRPTGGYCAETHGLFDLARREVRVRFESERQRALAVARVAEIARAILGRSSAIDTGSDGTRPWVEIRLGSAPSDER